MPSVADEFRAQAPKTVNLQQNRQEMQQLTGQGAGLVRPPGPVIPMPPLPFQHQPLQFGGFQQPPLVPAMTPQPPLADQFQPGWPVQDVAQAVAVARAWQGHQTQPANRGRAGQRGPASRNRGVQRRRSGHNNFNFQLSHRNQSFGQSQQRALSDFRRKQHPRGSRGKMHNQRMNAAGNRSRNFPLDGKGINISTTCNVTFLDAHEARKQMRDVGEKMALQIAEQVKERLSAERGTSSCGFQEDATNIQININLANNDTVADNIRQGEVDSLQPKRTKFDSSQSIYESKYNPAQISKYYVYTPSTVQQGCALGCPRETVQREQDAQPFILETTEGLTQVQQVEQLQQQLPSLTVYSEDYLQGLSHRAIQELWVQHELQNATSATCLDLSTTEMVDMLLEKFCHMRYFCCCASHHHGGNPQNAPANHPRITTAAHANAPADAEHEQHSAADDNDNHHHEHDHEQDQEREREDTPEDADQAPPPGTYKQLPCGHLLCPQCLGDSVRLEATDAGVRVGCPLCPLQDAQMASPSISLN